MVRYCFLFLPAIFLFLNNLQAQQNENKGWIFLSHTQKLNSKWDVLFDGQVRSVDKLQFVNTVLFRMGLNYNFNKHHSTAFGYTYKGDWEHEDHNINFHPENRMYEQYLFSSKIYKAELTARFRFEQRFIKEEKEYLFSQRARAFVAFQIPLITNSNFTKGMYANIQNEVFANVQRKQNVNNAFFDQNRLLGSLGYRWSQKLETEFGFMWWRQNKSDGYISSNVFQLMITTEL